MALACEASAFVAFAFGAFFVVVVFLVAICLSLSSWGFGSRRDLRDASDRQLPRFYKHLKRIARNSAGGQRFSKEGENPQPSAGRTTKPSRQTSLRVA